MTHLVIKCQAIFAATTGRYPLLFPKSNSNGGSSEELIQLEMFVAIVEERSVCPRRYPRFRTSRRSSQQLASRFFQVVSEAIEIALLRVPPRFDARTRYRIWRRGGILSEHPKKF